MKGIKLKINNRITKRRLENPQTFENKQLSQILDYLKISSQIDYTIKQMTSDDSSGIQNETVTLKKMR